MLFSTAILASVVVVVFGVLIFWANPARGVNRTVFLCSAIVAAWLACSRKMMSTDDGLFWLRCTCAVGGLAPVSLWLVKESILGQIRMTHAPWLRRNGLWFVGAVVFVILPFTNAFIPAHSSDADRLRGWGYYVYYGGLIASYAWLFFETLRSLKDLTGARRQELQVWLFGGCGVAVAVYILIGLSVLTHNPLYRGLKPLAVLVFYIGTGYAITTHRIFDSRQIVLVGVEKTLLGMIVVCSAYALHMTFQLVLPDTWALVFATLVVVWIAGPLGSWLDRKFHFLPQGVEARQAAFAAAQRETRAENLENSFCTILKSWGQTEHAMILTGAKDMLAGSGIEVSADSVIVGVMRQLRWATPERLMRERVTRERQAVGRFLAQHGLGAIAFAEGSALNVLVGVAVGAARRPYTYPQVMQLMELASIIQSALERAHFSAKVQHTEQLATVGLLGASLAHEIRNPLVTIKTFVQLLPKHHQDPAFREKFFRLIGDEVGRIDQLTEQLLDLASPRTYVAELVELHPVLRASLDLVAAKASDKKIQFLTDLQAEPDLAFTDSSAAKQVMLNLCFNAIQAVESGNGAERWVRIATRNIDMGIEMLVADSGNGISPEIRPRLFQPFQTTKSTGFGLGLAICSDILANLNASIAVDPSEPGRGATFRVIFPCQLSSS